uniref:Uncharacterized protein n=1 Tax=Hyaloperonospora arabidopsidis (strain Emoy2) TaxID=559515 RepID=M4BPV5_HYAAE
MEGASDKRQHVGRPRYNAFVARGSTPYYKMHQIPKWRSALKAHDLVQVGVQVPRLRHTKWRNATVIDVVSAASVGTGKKGKRSDGDGVGLQVHVQVDGGDFWLPAHDDLLCQVNTHTESSALSKRELELLLARNVFSLPEPREVAEEVTVPTKGGDGDAMQSEVEVEASKDEGGDGPTSHTSPSSSSRLHSTNVPIETATPSRSRMNLRTRAGPARDLSDSFSQAQVRGQSSAGHTPARSRGRRQSSQIFSDNTSPEPVSPASIPPAGRPGSRDLPTLWAQVSTDLLSLQASWVQLGEEVVALMETFERGQD